MYERSRTYASFNIAGFKHWDGMMMLDELKPGTQLQIVPEFDNPADQNALALYYNDTKLGYVPSAANAEMAQLIYFGYEDAFEAVVMSVKPDEDPWHQVYVGIRIKDARENKPTSNAHD